MSAGFALDARDLRAQLQALPEDVRREVVAPETRAAAHSLAGELRSTYPRRSGNLADHVSIDITDASARVRATARHAHLFEYGTVQRFTAGTGANRGTMPAHPIFVPAAVRWRGRMMQAVANRLRSARFSGWLGSLGAR